jgi:hypothetical protein
MRGYQEQEVEVQDPQPPLCPKIWDVMVILNFKPSHLENFNKKGYLREHLPVFNTLMGIIGASNL